MGSPEPITTGTHARVSSLEADVREIRGNVQATQDHVQTMRLDVKDISNAMLRIRDTVEEGAREATQYRRETRHDIKCITDTWAGFQKEFGPLLTELKDKRDDAKDTKKKLKIAYLTAGGLGIGGAVMTVLNGWASNVLKAINKLNGG